MVKEDTKPSKKEIGETPSEIVVGGIDAIRALQIVAVVACIILIVGFLNDVMGWV